MSTFKSFLHSIGSSKLQNTETVADEELPKNENYLFHVNDDDDDEQTENAFENNYDMEQNDDAEDFDDENKIDN